MCDAALKKLPCIWATDAYFLSAVIKVHPQTKYFLCSKKAVQFVNYVLAELFWQTECSTLCASFLKAQKTSF